MVANISPATSIHDEVIPGAAQTSLSTRRLSPHVAPPRNGVPMHRFLLAAAATAVSLLGAAPVRAVEAVQVWHHGREVAVIERDGWALYDGDILLGRMDDVLRHSAAESPDGTKIGSIAKS